MPPPPGFRTMRAFPDSRPALQRGGIHSWATGGWEMARRATRALAAMLACVALALPAVVLADRQPAAAATAHRAPPPVSVFISGMSPQWLVTSRTNITVRGTLHNNSRTPMSHLVVQLYGSSSPAAAIGNLQTDTNQPFGPAGTPFTGATWTAAGPLAPGLSVNWVIRVPASAVDAIGMTTFGAYPITAQVQGPVSNLSTTTTYLPYEPDKKSPYASSRPPAAKIAWLWPLIDVPILNEPWQGNCSGAQAGALAQSLGPDGRLGELASAGATDQSITWMIDPAVLANVQALSTCQSRQPRWAKAASTWLTDLRNNTSGRPVSVTPYGAPNVAALIASHGYDVKRSFDLGRELASKILRPGLSPAAATSNASTTADPLTQAAGIGWSETGVPGYGTVTYLASSGSVHTLVLSSSAFPDRRYSVVKTLDYSGYMTALLANQSLTDLLASRSTVPGAAFNTGQLFLAETALLTQQFPAQPIVVAPPPRWAPPAGLAADLLADTKAPWLSQVSLTSLASAKHIPTVPYFNWPALSLGPTRITRPELRKLRVLDHQIYELQSIRAHTDQALYLAISALESSALQGTSNSTADAMLATVAKQIARQQQQVRIIAEKRITLGGLKGSVPVSIDNRLGYPVKVALQLQYSQADGVKITTDPPGLVTIPARQTQTIRLRVQATNVGSTTVTMLLATRYGDTVSVPLRMTIQATQVGTLGVIIFAAALGIFLVASAARAVRRGRPGADAEQPAEEAPTLDHDGEGSANPAEADTVNAEHAELRAVGNPLRD